MSIKAIGKLTAASVENRTLHYRLLPYGESGSTSAGKVTASAGSLTVPGEPLPVNIEHDYTRPVGTMNVEESDDGLDATVDVARTRVGDDILEEAAAGLRKGISVEIDNPVIRAGKLVSGILSGAGVVVRPAFATAQLVASDYSETDPNPTPKGDPVPPEDKTADKTKDKTTEPPAPAAALPEPLLASMARFFEANDKKAKEEPKPKEGVTLAQLTATVFGIDGVTNPQLKAAALDVVTQADMYDPTSVPQYLDELAQARQYREVFSPLFTPGTLTSMEIEGWHIVKKPVVGPWDPAYSGVPPAEAMNDIPTSEVTFKKETWTAKRIAGGNRFDRIHVDFPNPRAMAAYVREQDQAVVERLDLLSKAQLTGLAVPKEADGTDAADVWSKLIFGVAHALKFGVPDYVLLGNDVWRQMKNESKIDAREFLAAELGLEEGSLSGLRLVPADVDDAAMTGKIYVGNTKACTLHTPPGSVVRVDAQELQKGAVDKAVFGYYAFVPHYEAATKNGIVEVVDLVA